MTSESLRVGSMIGAFQILSLIGKGGMGEVYRARDSRLKRDVAIKVLPDDFARDAERVARFQREAEVLASLNHPHIAAIYELSEIEGSRCLVLELVEGQTLAERIRRGPIPKAESLSIAKQIADALEAAHEKGVTHRDLKPANIKITPAGTVKVLDFGLAKVRGAEATESLSDAPTLTATTPGLIMGTPAYMSPEQARGAEADQTSDVWAFGCVLYEMLTGQRAFSGETASEVLVGVFKSEPEWQRLPADNPVLIRMLLRRCLHKDARLRFHDVRDVRILIDEAQSETDAKPAPLISRGRPTWVVALGLILAFLTVAWLLRSSPQAGEMRVDVTTPPTSSMGSLAVSPDGHKILYAATFGGRSQLWLRSLDSDLARPLPNTDNGQFPFWSPDNRNFGFFADRKLKRMDSVTGAVQLLAEAIDGVGGAWSSDGTILFGSYANVIWRVDATGGAPTTVTRLESSQTSHRFPQFLPDGNHFIYAVIGSDETAGAHIGRLNGPGSRRVMEVACLYVHSGQLLFIREDTLFAQDFDFAGPKLTGSPFLVAEHVQVDANGGLPFAASDSGVVVYRSTRGQQQFAWLDRAGRPLGLVGETFTGGSPELSPDGGSVVLHRPVSGRFEVSLLEMGRGILSRLSSEYAMFPVWSPDGKSIVFSKGEAGVLDLYRRELDRPASRALLKTPLSKAANDWHGDTLLYVSVDPKTNTDLFALKDGAEPFPVAATSASEQQGQFSPNGKWVAYQSNESGPFQIYVQPFPGPGRKYQISTNGGAQVRWHRGGTELFYIGLDGRLMAVPIRFGPNGDSIDSGIPVPLFPTKVGGAVQQVEKQQYVVSRDAERFLMNTISEEPNTSRMVLILNWKARP